jgi:hypothetical protein
VQGTAGPGPVGRPLPVGYGITTEPPDGRLVVVELHVVVEVTVLSTVEVVADGVQLGRVNVLLPGP